MVVWILVSNKERKSVSIKVVSLLGNKIRSLLQPSFALGCQKKKRKSMKKYILLFLAIAIAGCTDVGDLSTSRNLSGGYYTGDAGEPLAGDKYNDFEENPFVLTADAAVSTFAVDADGGAYANARRFLNEGVLPPKGAVRTEELINYFPLNYTDDNSGNAISLNGEVVQCPWTAGNKLVRIGIKGRSIPRNLLPASNIVMLVDVSGSMSSPDKLELLKSGYKLLVDEFTAKDKISLVTYAGYSEVALASTPGDQKAKIKQAIDKLGAGGSTAGAQGIITAYAIAQQNFIEGGNNRVILGTDGDFNVGISNSNELVSMIEKKRDTGIFLTVLGVGRGNYNEAMMEQVADHGNGTYEYIDNIQQAKKVFVDEYHKFFPAAKDVKVQVEFNPALVESYRLIGYENRLLEQEDFEDDKKDAGEISVGQNITALYEIKPRSGGEFRQSATFTINFRYKLPGSETSVPLSLEIFDEGVLFQDASENMVFTASVAGFGMLMRNSNYKGTLTYDQVQSWVSTTLGYDPQGLRAEFSNLVKKAKQLSGNS
jgi:Ca-activated chloride channel family protein